MLGIVFGWFVVVLILEKMTPKRGYKQAQGDLSSMHPFYRFPRNILQEGLERFNSVLGWLYNRDFVVDPVIHWVWITYNEIMDQIN